MVKRTKMSKRYLRRNHNLLNDNKNILHKVYNLKLYELRQILDAVKENKIANTQITRQHISDLLETSSKSKYLIEKINEVYNSRAGQTHQSQYNSYSETFQLQSVDSVQRSLSNPFGNNLVDPLQDLQKSITEFEQQLSFKIMQTLLYPIHYKTENNEVNFTYFFSLKDDVKHLIAKSWNISNQEHKFQIIIRLVQIGPEENETECLPNNLAVHVNDRQCKLTEVDVTKWRCNVSINITREIDLKNSLHNKLQVSWSSDPHQYIAGLFVVQKLKEKKLNKDLVAQLKEKPYRPSNKTKEFIKESFKSDADLVADFFFTSLRDPLSKIRMQLPVRGMDCIHIQCFDAIQFLKMNELKPTWICPLCKKNAKFENIQVDEYFLNILENPNLSEECDSVMLLTDGSWTENTSKRNQNTSKANYHPSTSNYEVVIVSDFNDENDDPPIKRSKNSSTKVEQPTIKEIGKRNQNTSKTNDHPSTNIVEVFTLSDSNDENYDPPIKRSKYCSTKVKQSTIKEMSKRNQNIFKTNDHPSTNIIEVFTLSDSSDETHQ